MRTPRRRRLTRRQSEQLLDGLGESGDLARLLAAARPLRASGELPGENAALAAFREAAVERLDTRPRGAIARTRGFRRSLALKVLTVTAASVTVGGVAMAATGNLPGPLAAVPAATRTAHSTGTPGVVKDGESVGVSPRTRDRSHPTGSPSGRPDRSNDPMRMVGLCRAWSESTANSDSAPTRSTRFRELVDEAGDTTKVASYCAEQTRAWCEDHHWPGPTPVQVDSESILMRCVRPTGTPSASPGGRNSGDRSGPGKNTLPPTHQSGQGSDRPAPLPTSAPARN